MYVYKFLYIQWSNGCIITALFIHRHTVINIQTHFNVNEPNEEREEKEGVLIISIWRTGKFSLYSNFTLNTNFYMHVFECVLTINVGYGIKKNNKMICEPIDSTFFQIRLFQWQKFSHTIGIFSLRYDSAYRNYLSIPHPRMCSKVIGH